MSTLQTTAALALVAGFSTWLAVGAWLVADRARFDRRGRRPGRTRRGTWAQVEALASAPLEEARSALHDPRAAVVAAAMARLGRIGEPAAADALVDALVLELHPASRVAAQLDVFPLPVCDRLLALASHDEARVRFWGATLLRRHAASPDAAAALARAAADPDPNVRAAAAESLGAAGASAVLPLGALLGDDVWYVRAHAARAAGEIARPELVASAAPLLADHSWWVRAAAKEALERLGPAAEPAMIAYLEHPDRFARNGAAEVLQNTGLLGRLVAAARDDAHSWAAPLLERIYRAGEAGLAHAAAERARRETSDIDTRQVA